MTLIMSIIIDISPIRLHYRTVSVKCLIKLKHLNFMEYF